MLQAALAVVVAVAAAGGPPPLRCGGPYVPPTDYDQAGKPVTLAKIEVQRAQSTFELAAAGALEPNGHPIEMGATPAGAGHVGLARRFPLGVILGIAPFNFPHNLVAHKVATCLATGNTMILKPAMKTPLCALLLGEILPMKVYATLLPIIGGVAIASMKELSFTMLALASAMLSNVSSSLRGVLSKKTMSGKKIGENLDAQNLYAVLTAMSTVMLIPMMLAVEGTGFLPAFQAAVKAGLPRAHGTPCGGSVTGDVQ
jgi:hypothetical protein